MCDSTFQELVLDIISKTDQDQNKAVSYEEILPWYLQPIPYYSLYRYVFMTTQRLSRFQTMNEKFWKMTHPKSEEEKACELAAAATAEKPFEHSQPQKERSASQPDAVPPPPPPETVSISDGAAGGSPSKFGGLGVRPHPRSLITPVPPFSTLPSSLPA